LQEEHLHLRPSAFGQIACFDEQEDHLHLRSYRRSGRWSGNRRPLWWLAVSHDLLSKSRDRRCGGTNGGAEQEERLHLRSPDKTRINQRGKIHLELNKEIDMEQQTGTFAVKKGLAQMLKGGVIMDVVTPEHARIAEEAGACAVMALERVPADIRAQGGVARMSDPDLILKIMDTVTIPVMAKCRIGHFVEAQILEAIGVDYIDESEVLTPADEANHINKHLFKVPFVCGCRNLGEALRRIGEGAAMIRTKGEAGTGDVVEAVRHARSVMGAIRQLQTMAEEELMAFAKELGAPYELVKETKELGRMPVVNFAAGGVATPADAALMMQLGVDGVFVGSGIFKSGDPAKRAAAIVKSVTHYQDASILAEVSKNLGEPMVGRNVSQMPEAEKIAQRGW
jgi:pyridoxal 5'-phosphate synthase pdxS subunit